MVRLHLIGFTTDLKNLIFATRRGAKRGGYILEIDKRLLGALEEVARLEAEGETGHNAQSKPSAAVHPPPAPESALSPKEIQALLREGKSEDQVAKLAGTDVSWIRRFTGPIIAERAGVIESVRAGLIAKPRLGPSAVTVGQAIEQNLMEKRVPMDPESFERSWKAIRRAGRWQVLFQYSSRGRRRLARFSFDPESREVAAANDVALDVGWRPDTRKPRRSNSSGTARKRVSSSRAGNRSRGRSPAKKRVSAPTAVDRRSSNGRPKTAQSARSSRSRA